MAKDKPNSRDFASGGFRPPGEVEADHGRPLASFKTVAEAQVWLGQQLARAAP